MCTHVPMHTEATGNIGHLSQLFFMLLLPQGLSFNLELNNFGSIGWAISSRALPVYIAPVLSFWALGTLAFMWYLRSNSHPDVCTASTLLIDHVPNLRLWCSETTYFIRSSIWLWTLSLPALTCPSTEITTVSFHICLLLSTNQLKMNKFDSFFLSF